MNEERRHFAEFIFELEMNTGKIAGVDLSHVAWLSLIEELNWLDQNVSNFLVFKESVDFNHNRELTRIALENMSDADFKSIIEGYKLFRDFRDRQDFSDLQESSDSFRFSNMM